MKGLSIMAVATTVIVSATTAANAFPLDMPRTSPTGTVMPPKLATLPNTKLVSSVLEFPEFQISEVWSNLSPIVKKNKEHGLECVIEWEPSKRSSNLIVRDVLLQISSWFDFENEVEEKKALKKDILQSIETFQNICESSVQNIASYKIKVGAMYRRSGTRCPSFHTDYVPMRWIQTMKGPGCVYINPKDIVDFPHIQNLSGSGLGGPAKESVIKQAGVRFRQQTTTPMILAGAKFNVTKKPTLPLLQGVLHRSPHNVPAGRVLLTLDVITGPCGAEEEEDLACQKGCCQRD